MNPFDDMRDGVFDMVADTMGYTATWTPIGSTDEQTANVLYKSPSEREMMGDNDYDPEQHEMEYRAPFFPGLKESADGNKHETVVIQLPDGNKTFWVQYVKAKWDGNTYCAYMREDTV